MAAKGQVSEALAGAAVTTLLLTLRAQAHAILKGMTAQEVDSIARFALVALVILPLLPDRNLGPYDAWNPRQIWMVVVVVLGLSFAGYVATRRSEEHTSELQSLMRISYAVFCLKKKKTRQQLKHLSYTRIVKSHITITL